MLQYLPDYLALTKQYGSSITISRNGKVVQLLVETLDTHNYLAASDMVIAKASWGIITEAIIARWPMVLLEREAVIKDTHNIAELKRRGVAISIKESELSDLDMAEIKREIQEGISLETLNRYENQVDKVLEVLGIV